MDILRIPPSTRAALSPNREAGVSFRNSPQARKLAFFVASALALSGCSSSGGEQETPFGEAPPAAAAPLVPREEAPSASEVLPTETAEPAPEPTLEPTDEPAISNEPLSCGGAEVKRISDTRVKIKPDVVGAAPAGSTTYTLIENGLTDDMVAYHGTGWHTVPYNGESLLVALFNTADMPGATVADRRPLEPFLSMVIPMYICEPNARPE